MNLQTEVDEICLLDWVYAVAYRFIAYSHRNLSLNSIPTRPKSSEWMNDLGITISLPHFNHLPESLRRHHSFSKFYPVLCHTTYEILELYCKISCANL